MALDAGIVAVKRVVGQGQSRSRPGLRTAVLDSVHNAIGQCDCVASGSGVIHVSSQQPIPEGSSKNAVRNGDNGIVARLDHAEQVLAALWAAPVEHLNMVERSRSAVDDDRCPITGRGRACAPRGNASDRVVVDRRKVNGLCNGALRDQLTALHADPCAGSKFDNRSGVDGKRCATRHDDGSGHQEELVAWPSLTGRQRPGLRRFHVKDFGIAVAVELAAGLNRYPVPLSRRRHALAVAEV